ncbi:MAG: isocitrate/isopropylmalate family dehydrogenase [Acidobacteriota bacterium]|jgi:isocitrate/isopropylmalate dehydrogenase
MTERTTPTIALLGGDGIGPEVVEATATVLAALLPDARFLHPPHGQPALDRHGDALPEESRQACRDADAVLFGATAGPSHPVLRFLRWGLDTYANLRPARTLPGLPSPLASDAPIDLLVVRENLEGEYPGREGEVAEFRERWPGFRDNIGRELPAEGLFTLRLTTEEGSRRVARAAARQALARTGRVAVVTKANILRKTDGLFRRLAEEELDAAGVEHRHLYVDDACRRLVAEPWDFDVILAPNLFGDILSDVAAELTGGMGMAPSGCIGDRGAYFESVHGAAPDIAGRGVANPLATVLSAQMMLEHLGRDTEARALGGAVERLLTDRRVLTPDLGGTAGTGDVTRALIELLD